MGTGYQNRNLKQKNLFPTKFYKNICNSHPAMNMIFNLFGVTNIEIISFSN